MINPGIPSRTPSFQTAHSRNLPKAWNESPHNIRSRSRSGPDFQLRWRKNGRWSSTDRKCPDTRSEEADASAPCIFPETSSFSCKSCPTQRPQPRRTSRTFLSGYHPPCFIQRFKYRLNLGMEKPFTSGSTVFIAFNISSADSFDTISSASKFRIHSPSGAFHSKLLLGRIPHPSVVNHTGSRGLAYFSGVVGASGIYDNDLISYG